MGKVADEITDGLRERTRAGMRQMAADTADDVRELISVPVEYTSGPRGGIHVIRSKPGEPPRKETGQLQASIRSELLPDNGDDISSVAYTDSKVSGYLENGTERIAPRPHWGPTFIEWSRKAASYLAAYLKHG